MELEQFIVEAKARTYVSGGKTSASSRSNSHDLRYENGEWSYLDSYFGGTDFVGQEAVWCNGEPLWSMCYYGQILKAGLIDAERAGETILAALSEMYAQGRFLGGFKWSGPHGDYVDSSVGDVSSFEGKEVIIVGDDIAYQLRYFGGLIKA
ncbi:DUF5680 domain-containing protein [Maritalea sp.]|uniref:DUF5680 domain-containing protein n=1 Tax=Maritalea sp. TaxID=2003361 RepID=UPI003EF23F5C